MARQMDYTGWRGLNHVPALHHNAWSRLIQFMRTEREKGQILCMKTKVLRTRGKGYGLGLEERTKVHYLFANPFLLSSTSLNSCRIWLLFSCGGLGCCRAGAFKNSFGCELLGEGREFLCSPKGPWRYPGLSKHHG